MWRITLGRSDVDKPDHRHRRLLRARRKRPRRRRATEKRDELAPLHVFPLGTRRVQYVKPSTLRPGGEWEMAHNRHQNLIRADVRFGSKADICNAKKHVRFTPNSGHVQCNSACPLCANSGHPTTLRKPIIPGGACILNCARALRFAARHCSLNACGARPLIWTSALTR